MNLYIKLPVKNNSASKSTKSLEKSSNGKKGFGCFKIALIIILTLILIFGGFLFFATSELRRSDEEVLKTYKPTPEVAEIAEKNTLTDKGKALLYRADPKFIDSQTFIKYCQTISRGIEALACIAPKVGGGPFGGRQIYLLEIDDPKFADHKYSAAIHEMLHSAYQRLNSDEEKSVNALLDAEALKHQDDPHLSAVIEILKNKKGDKGILEEMHSKFGVEYKNISPELEEYYKQYFTDRSKVVELFQKGGFNSRVRRLDQINSELSTLNTKLTEMNSQLVALKNSGDIDKFNSLVGQYNSLVGQYNAEVTQSKRVYSEVEKFYQYFNPDYKPPEEKK